MKITIDHSPLKIINFHFIAIISIEIFHEPSHVLFERSWKINNTPFCNNGTGTLRLFRNTTNEFRILRKIILKIESKL